jgi:ferritin-like metal-binding protein YciE
MKMSRSKSASPKEAEQAAAKGKGRGARLQNHVMGALKSTAGAIHSEPSTKDLRGLFIHQLKDIYWVEKELVKAIPVMAKKAAARKLVEALSAHLKETKDHVTRLEKVFSILKEKAEAHKCDGMKGLLNEADHMMKKIDEGAVRDAAIIISAQKVEHYEIVAYGSLSAMASILGESESANLLKETLKEEKNADMKLTEVATAFVNKDAVNEFSGNEEEDLSGPVSS